MTTTTSIEHAVHEVAPPMLTQLSSRLYSRLAKALRASRGSTILEVAIAMPLFATLLFGIFEFSMILTSYQSANFAARAGARYASLHSSTSLSPATLATIQSTVKSVLFTPGVSSVSTAVVYQDAFGNSTGNVTGSWVIVTVTMSQTFSVPGYSKTFSTQTTAYRDIVV